MAKRAHVYPQVDPGAAGLIDATVLAVPRTASVGQALGLARRRGAAVVTPDGRAFILRDDLARASQLELDDLPAVELTRPVPVVEPGASEVSVRRRLATGVPAVIVSDGRRGPLGAVTQAQRPVTVVSLGPWFERRLPEPARRVVTLLAGIAAERQVAVFLAGGVVRDALADDSGEGRDLDVVVEGDGPAVARALAAALGTPGRDIVEHARFMTASLTAPGLGRIDVATARSERYEAPGALPRVLPGSMGQDMARRDFTINAMAVELASGSFGLLDRFGGRAALGRRRITALHPLSFVEDPTRIFRAARYAARLGFTLDAWTARTQTLALRVAPYPALSGQRLAAELELIVGDRNAATALARLGAAGALKLLDRRYRFTRATAERIARLAEVAELSRTWALRVGALELAALVILGDQSPDVARDTLARLGLSGEPLARLTRALDRAAPAADLTTRRASARAQWLREKDDVELLAAWLAGGQQARQMVEWYLAEGRTVRSALGGDELIGLGVPPGPAIAGVLAALRDARLDGTLADRDGELAYVRDWIDRRGEG